MKMLLLLLSTILALLPARFEVPAGIKVSENTVTLQFPNAVEFHIAVSSGENITRVTLVYGTENQSCQPNGARQQIEFSPAAELSLDWVLEFKRSGIFPPGARLWWQWELVVESGAALTTNRQNLVVNDMRHTWNQIQQRGVVLQWYIGDQAFGQSLMNSIGAHKDRLSATLGLRASNPIWITVYPTVDEIKEVLLHTYEWTGAVAFPAYNSILLPVSPGESGTWATDALAHEMTHLLVSEMMFNCLGINQPTWLSEGLAMNGEGPLTDESRQIVLAALKAGNLPALSSLNSDFSAEPFAARLSYSQSAAVVSYLLQKGGAQKLGTLLTVMQSGLTVDEALRKVYGVNTTELDTEWRTSLGYPPAVVTIFSPKLGTSTFIPTVALWTSVVRASATPSAAPTASPVTPTPTLTPAPSATAQPSPTPQPGLAFPFCLSSLAIPAAMTAGWYLNHQRRLT